MRKRLRTSLVAALAMPAIGASPAFPASASADHTTCPNNYICFYEHINFNHDRNGWVD